MSSLACSWSPFDSCFLQEWQYFLDYSYPKYCWQKRLQWCKAHHTPYIKTLPKHLCLYYRPSNESSKFINCWRNHQKHIFYPYTIICLLLIFLLSNLTFSTNFSILHSIFHTFLLLFVIPCCIRLSHRRSLCGISVSDLIDIGSCLVNPIYWNFYYFQTNG